SLITNISLDHTHLLGNSLQEIAREKAGIIKRGTPVVISEKAQTTASIFQEIAKENRSKIVFASSIRAAIAIEKSDEELVLKINSSETPDSETFKLDLTGL